MYEVVECWFNIGTLYEVRGVPSHMRDSLSRIVETVNGSRHYAQTMEIWRFFGSLKENLHADTNSEVGFSRLHILFQRF